MARARTNDKRLWFALAALAVLLLALALWLRSRPGQGGGSRGQAHDGTATAPPPLTHSVAPPSGPTLTAPATVALPKGLRFNSIGQPLGPDGRPIGPPSAMPIRNPPLDVNGLPLPPPLFDDPSARAQFKQWWVDGFVQRARIYEHLVPAAHYPSDDEVRQMMDRFYDLAEPQGPDESRDAYQGRAGLLMQRAYPEFVAAFDGATPYTVQARASDPAYGPFPPPPVQPPGTEVAAAPDEPPPPGKITPTVEPAAKPVTPPAPPATPPANQKDQP